MASLYLIRHGQASFGADNYDALSELGMRQCRLLGEWWRARGHTFERVFSGPMQRHRQSLDAFAAGLERQLPYDTLAGIAEFDHENVLEVYRPEFRDKAAMAHFLATTPRPRQAFRQIFTDAVNRAKPTGAKGTYLKRVALTSTQGAGVRVDPASLSAG